MSIIDDFRTFICVLYILLTSGGPLALYSLDRRSAGVSADLSAVAWADLLAVAWADSSVVAWAVLLAVVWADSSVVAWADLSAVAWVNEARKRPHWLSPAPL